MAITKEQLDTEFTNRYDELKQKINGMKIKYNSSLDATTVLSEAYINMTKKLDKIQPDKIGHFILSFARVSLQFKTASINKEQFYFNNDNTFLTNVSYHLTHNETYSNEEWLESLQLYEEDEEDEEINYTLIIDNLLLEFNKGLNIIEKIYSKVLPIYIIEQNNFKVLDHIDDTPDTASFHLKEVKQLYKKFIEFIKNKNK